MLTYILPRVLSHPQTTFTAQHIQMPYMHFYAAIFRQQQVNMFAYMFIEGVLQKWNPWMLNPQIQSATWWFTPQYKGLELSNGQYT